MPKANLTAASVERLKTPPSGQIEYYDRRLPAFGLRISYHGARSWFLMTRLDGKLIRMTLGRHPTLSLAEARQMARETMELTAAGTDPRRLRAEAEAQRERERRSTFSVCADEFLKLHAERRLRMSTQREYRRLLQGPDTQHWQHRRIREITKREVYEVIEAIDRRNAHGYARRALVYLRKFFNWCAEREIIVAPPTDRISPPHPEVKRDRVLSDDEVRYLMQALEAERTVIASAIRILLLTGQRRAEVAGMRWSELADVDTAAPVWQIPGARTKNGESHLVPLTPFVVEIVQSMPRTTSDLVFTTTGMTPVSGFGKAKARIDSRITALRKKDGLGPMLPWRLHDLRRTMVTGMNEKLGVAPHVVEAVVNHMSGLAKAGVAGVYNRALYLDDRKRALRAWEEHISALLRGR